jgi:hypothetical protein
MRGRRQGLQTLVTDIIVDVDDDARAMWCSRSIGVEGNIRNYAYASQGLANTGCATTEDALAVMCSMAGRAHEHIAASLNRMGLPTGPGQDLDGAPCGISASRARNPRYRSAEKNGLWLTMTDVAKALHIINHVVRRLIKTGVSSAVQVVPEVPYQIRADELVSEPVKGAIARKRRPCRFANANTLPMFKDTWQL